MAQVIVRGPKGVLIRSYTVPNSADKPEADMDQGQAGIVGKAELDRDLEARVKK